MHYKEDDMSGANYAIDLGDDPYQIWPEVLDGVPIEDVHYTIVSEFDPHQEDICGIVLYLLVEGKIGVRDGKVYAL